MSKKKHSTEEDREKYYIECAKNFMHVRNKQARFSYGIRTEPDEDLPNHQSILPTWKLRKIQLIFIAGILRDVLANAAYHWIYGNRLPGMRAKIQPMGEVPKLGGPYFQ